MSFLESARLRREQRKADAVAGRLYIERGHTADKKFKIAFQKKYGRDLPGFIRSNCSYCRDLWIVERTVERTVQVERPVDRTVQVDDLEGFNASDCEIACILMGCEPYSRSDTEERKEITKRLMRDHKSRVRAPKRIDVSYADD